MAAPFVDLRQAEIRIGQLRVQLQGFLVIRFRPRVVTEFVVHPRQFVIAVGDLRFQRDVLQKLCFRLFILVDEDVGASPVVMEKRQIWIQLFGRFEFRYCLVRIAAVVICLPNQQVKLRGIGSNLCETSPSLFRDCTLSRLVGCQAQHIEVSKVAIHGGPYPLQCRGRLCIRSSKEVGEPQKVGGLHCIGLFPHDCFQVRDGVFVLCLPKSDERKVQTNAAHCRRQSLRLLQRVRCGCPVLLSHVDDAQVRVRASIRPTVQNGLEPALSRIELPSLQGLTRCLKAAGQIGFQAIWTRSSFLRLSRCQGVDHGYRDENR